jgi:cardiolipin-specific phospholipase
LPKILVLSRLPPTTTTAPAVAATVVKRWNSSATTTATATTARGAYRSPTPPTGVPLSRLLSNTFPLSYSESYSQWVKRTGLQEAEKAVLSCLPFYPEPDATRRARSFKVPIGDNNHINEFEITRNTSEPISDELVVLHGYGAGLGFFYKTFEGISNEAGWRIHGLDLLGYGCSSRPKFELKSKSADPLVRTLEAEDFFIDALEAWRIERGIETFSLVAHSLGAYLGASYAAKYPGRINKLMLVSPAGVTRSSYAIDSGETPEMPLPEMKAKAPLWFHYLWECNVSPFSLVRNTGPLGPRFVSGWSSRRFANLPSKEARALHMYAYTIFNAAGSGEYALNYLLAPGAYGRRPLASRAHEIPCPTYWIYGDNDWMDVKGGQEACNSIAGRWPADLVTVSNSGHHIYLDNPQELNYHIKKFMHTNY